MRMNRNTVFLIALLLVVIAAVLLINNNQASAPGTTPTPQEATGPLFASVTADDIVRYEVRDNTSGTYVSLTKDSGGAWHVDGTNALVERDPDQSLISTTAGQIATINYNNTFQDDQLATFGLDAPQYSVLITTSDGQFYSVYVGNKAPTSSRYYAVVEQGTAPVSTAEAAPQAIATEPVDGQNANESGIVPSSDATAEATAEATANVASKRAFRQATEEPTAEVTAEMMATTEAMLDMTAEPTAEATADVIQSPAITLSGSQTIYVVPQTVIDTLKRWLTTPPYAPLPTGVPTDEFSTEPTLEVTEAVSTAEPTAEAEATATAEAAATAEATAAS